jgi:hypothetical protein
MKMIGDKQILDVYLGKSKIAISRLSKINCIDYDKAERPNYFNEVVESLLAFANTGNYHHFNIGIIFE